jgi:hypothetical protein
MGLDTNLSILNLHHSLLFLLFDPPGTNFPPKRPFVKERRKSTFFVVNRKSEKFFMRYSVDELVAKITSGRLRAQALTTGISSLTSVTHLFTLVRCGADHAAAY